MTRLIYLILWILPLSGFAWNDYSWINYTPGAQDVTVTLDNPRVLSNSYTQNYGRETGKFKIHPGRHDRRVELLYRGDLTQNLHKARIQCGAYPILTKNNDELIIPQGTEVDCSIISDLQASTVGSWVEASVTVDGLFILAHSLYINKSLASSATLNVHPNRIDLRGVVGAPYVTAPFRVEVKPSVPSILYATTNLPGLSLISEDGSVVTISEWGGMTKIGEYQPGHYFVPYILRLTPRGPETAIGALNFTLETL